MNHRIISVFIAVVIVAAIVGEALYWHWPGTGPMLGTPAAEAEPLVAWFPATVVAPLGPGSSSTVSVSFVLSEHATDVSVRVVPELVPFVKVSPTSYPRIEAGEVRYLNLTISPDPS